jgi:predicted metal-dependent phosphoesterase TrpH
MTESCLPEHKQQTGYADLHTHTTASDGLLTPSELVKKAAGEGFRAIGIADHDSIDGIAEASDASQRYGIEVVPAVELNTQIGNQEIHLLGYYIQTDLVWFRDFLSNIRHSRLLRARKIVDNLRRIYGMDISYEDVENEAKDGIIARPHIARVLVKKKIVSDMSEAYTKYIGNNCPAFQPRYKLTPEEGIKIITQAGGIPVLAHPGLLPDMKLVYYVIGLGLKGIEAWHSRHTPGQSRLFVQMAQKYGLIATGGSDYHGNDEAGGIRLGDAKVPYSVVCELKESARQIMHKK